MVKSRILILSSALITFLSGPLPAQDAGAARGDVLGMGSMKIQAATTPKPAGVKAATPAATKTNLTIQRYQEAIQKTEQASGAYGDRLWEQLMGLGIAEQNAGRYADAVASLNQALHIHRVNHGLHNIAQLPIINLLIKNNTALSDWKALDQNYHYLYWLYRRVYGDNDMHLLPVIYRVGKWQLQAYSMDTAGDPLSHLKEAQNVYADAVRIIESRQGKYAPGLIKPLYGIMLTNYYIARDMSYVSPFPSNPMCGRDAFIPRDPFYDDCYDNRQSQEQANRQEAIIMSYRTGKQALTHIIHVYKNNPNPPVLGYAKAYMRLGDWYMLFNRPSSAISTYAKAYAMLGNSDAAKKKMFGAPRAIPENTSVTGSIAGHKPAEKYIVVSMDITSTGRVRNIQVVKSQPPGDKKMLSRVRNNLRDARFAPRFVNGEPVATTGFTKKFIFE